MCPLIVKCSIGSLPCWQRGHCEHEEGEGEKNVVERREAAEDLDERGLQLDLAVIQHEDGEAVPEEAEQADDGHDEALDRVLERGARVHTGTKSIRGKCDYNGATHK